MSFPTNEQVSSLDEGSSSKKPDQIKAKRTLYYRYKSENEIIDGVKQGKFVWGVLKVNPVNSRIAYVSQDSSTVPKTDLSPEELVDINDSTDEPFDIVVNGPINRNRAIHGDLVCVEILGSEKCSELLGNARCRKCVARRKALENNRIETNPVMTSELDHLVQQVENIQLDNENMLEDETSFCLRTTGSVVAVSEKANRTIVGKFPVFNTDIEKCEEVKEDVQETLATIQDDNLDKVEEDVNPLPKRVPFAAFKRFQYSKYRDYLIFQPCDKRNPLILVKKTNKINEETINTNNLYTVLITYWREYMKYPMGTLAEDLGNISSVQTHTKAILSNQKVRTFPFTDKILKCVPPKGWTIPRLEYQKRFDMRKDCIFTIDPPDCKDRDDAISFRQLNDGFVEIGVHIADVSYFVLEKTAIDLEARERSTSVYLVDGVIPMLPHDLGEEFCSLDSGRDRLAFSVLWKMNENGEILQEWIGRTIINTCAQFAYEEVQTVLNTDKFDESVEILRYSKETVVSAIKSVNEIALKLRSNRFESGAISLDRKKIKIDLKGVELDGAIPSVLSAGAESRTQSNRLIEEFMLLANSRVAKKLYETFPTCSLLRRHSPPDDKRLQEVADLANLAGIEFDISNNVTLCKSLESIADPVMKELFYLVTTFPMQRAEYICSSEGESSHHYALNTPFYTHFTSPIRRYADIVVHRLLHEASRQVAAPSMKVTTLENICNHANERKFAAMNAQDSSNKLFLAYYLSSETSVKVMDAIVWRIEESGRVNVYISQYGYDGVMLLKNEKLQGEYDIDFQAKKGSVSIIWKRKSDGTITDTKTIKVLDRLQVEMCVKKDTVPMSIKIYLENHDLACKKE